MPLATYQDLCIDVTDATVSGAYWSAMLGWELEPHDDGDAHLRDQAGRIQVWLDVVPEPRTVKNRVHLDVNAESVQRALDAGATVLQEFPRWTMLADPEGQEHCVFARAEPFEKRAYELGWDCAEGPEVSHGLAAWWREMLGGAVVDDEREGYSWLQDIPGCPWDSFDFSGVPEPKTGKNRVHIDVVTDDLDALVSHGASVVRPEGRDGIDSTVLADPRAIAATGYLSHRRDPRRVELQDPAGNEFCAFVV